MAEEIKVPDWVLPEHKQRYLDIEKRLDALRKALATAEADNRSPYKSEEIRAIENEITQTEFEQRRVSASAQDTPTELGEGRINEQTGYWEAKDNQLRYNARGYVSRRFQNIAGNAVLDAKWISRMLRSLDAGMLSLDVNQLGKAISKQVEKELQSILDKAAEAPKYNRHTGHFDKNYWTEEFERKTYPQKEYVEPNKSSRLNSFIYSVDEALEGIMARVELPEGFELKTKQIVENTREVRYGEEPKYKDISDTKFTASGTEYTIVHKKTGLEFKFTNTGGLHISDGSTFKMDDGRVLTFGHGDINNPISRFDLSHQRGGSKPLMILNNEIRGWNGKPTNSLLEGYEAAGRVSELVDNKLTIYKIVPRGSEDIINPNDWVFANKKQADEALQNYIRNGYNSELVSMNVDAGDVYYSNKGNVEFGYMPKSELKNPFSYAAIEKANDLKYGVLKALGPIIDPIEEAVAFGLTRLGMPAVASAFLTYELNNMVAGLLRLGGSNMTQMQLEKSMIFGEALGLVDDRTEVLGGNVEERIMEEAVNIVSQHAALSPTLQIENAIFGDQSLHGAVYNKGKDILKGFDTSNLEPSKPEIDKTMPVTMEGQAQE